jgi:hypothetical protein
VGSLVVVTVAGDHDTFLKMPLVQQSGAILNKTLCEADEWTRQEQDLASSQNNNNPSP